MIINIHGFGGRGDNSKYKWLCENAGHHEIYSPTLDYVSENPGNILSHLSNRISLLWQTNSEDAADVCVVGSSLGGFFARRLNQIYPGVTAILINPSLAPFLTARNRLPVHQCQGYLNLLAEYAYEDDPEYGNKYRLHVIIGDSDEVIDHERMTKPLLPTSFDQLYTIKGGTHQLEITPEVDAILRSVITPLKEGTGTPSPHRHYFGRKLLP
jgi:predicted esterase YcpF (UPF0227 family)